MFEDKRSGAYILVEGYSVHFSSLCEHNKRRLRGNISKRRGEQISQLKGTTLIAEVNQQG
jgi:hypothetical protein